MKTEEIRKHFDAVAAQYDTYKKRNKYYHTRVRKFYKEIIPERSRVLEVGCATGDLLAAVKPSYGLGIDISGKMIEEAKKKHTNLDFKQGKMRDLPPRNDFDFIILSNLLDYVEDIYDFFKRLKDWANDETRIILNNVNPLWAPVIRLGAKFWLRTPDARRNFVTLRDVCGLLETLDFDISEKGFRLIFPLYIPLFSNFVNKVLPRLYGINNLSAVQYAVCRKKQRGSKRNEMSCTVVIPCHNEEGNIEECVRRTPALGVFTEIIIVDDGSTDGTFQAAEKAREKDSRVRVIRIEGNRGKGNAVKTGFDNARGEILIILDADMAVSPEEVRKFFNAIADGKAEFVNGTRMIYPMEKEAMKFANYIGNKMFGILTSVIMCQRNTDTLCGTKAVRKRHYKHMEMNDCKWGDFDLLYGAARQKLKMVEMPVHYKKRTSGSSKMKALKHSFGMLQRCFAMFRNLE